MKHLLLTLVFLFSDELGSWKGKAVKRLLLILVMFACAGLPDLAHALTCPNRPAGSTTLATVHFNTNDGEGQLWDLYPGAGTITTVSGSEGSVSASILAPETSHH